VPAFALAAALGASGASRLIPTLLLFGLLEAVTIVCAATLDDYGDDFRGDREVFVRGSLANGAVVAVVVITAAL
jgi:hypothetical protein